MLNGNTASFTPTKGALASFNFGKSLIFLPSIISVARRAIGTPVTFEMIGTVRDARGLASRM
ncbi:MAG: hypothetical protein BWY49_01139 [Candidatus Omnitrophica bacterium ADurb.Bin314]|nr:MAG: hypothetical protein BWY49_01139 [Candidatus Omnitrophica bacterium ADurb.Bin314]